MSENFKKATEFVKKVAKLRSWELNPDREFLDSIIEGLATNYERYGYYLCPCRDGSGDRTEDRDIICPCTYCVPDQKEYGYCYCGLFLTKEFAEEGKQVSQIPERRPPEKM